MIALWAGLTSLTVLFLYGAAQLNFNEGDYLFWGAATVVLAGWLARKSLSSLGLALSLICAHIAAVCLLHPAPFQFLLRLATMLGLPLLAVWLVKKKRLPLWLAVAAFAAALAADLLDYFNAGRFLYETQSPPISDTRLRPPKAPRPRIVATPLLSNYNSEEGMRYVELLYRVPVVFSSFAQSTQYHGDDPFSEEFLAAGLSSKQWTGFLVSRRYWRLTHLGLEPALLKSIFAVGAAPFQVKNCAVAMEDDELRPFFDKLGKARGLAWLDACVSVAPEHQTLLSAWLKPASAAAPSPPPPLRYSISPEGFNSLTLSAESAGGVLYWADGYNRWWRAEINGREAPLARANIHFKALALPAGKIRVRLTYRPIAFLAGMGLYYGTLAAALAAAAWLSLRRRGP